MTGEHKNGGVELVIIIKRSFLRFSRICSVLLLIVFSYACDMDTSSTSSPDISEFPKFSKAPKIEANPNPSVPLAAIVSFKSKTPTKAIYTISDGHETWSVQGVEFSTDHRKSLTQFVTGVTHRINIQLEDKSGVKGGLAEVIFDAPNIAPSLPEVEGAINKLLTKESGIVLIGLARYQYGTTTENTGQFIEIDSTYGAIIGVNSFNKIVWFFNGVGGTKKGKAIYDYTRRKVF